MEVDHFTVTAAQIAIEQGTAYVAIPCYFIAMSGLITGISPSLLGQEVELGGQVIFPMRKWTHPLKAEIDWWYQQQRKEKMEDMQSMQEGLRNFATFVIHLCLCQVILPSNPGSEICPRNGSPF